METILAFLAAPGLAEALKALGGTTAGGEIKLEVGDIKLTLKVNAQVGAGK